MSSYVYPSNILGLAFGVNRTPVWKTSVQTALSGKQSAIGYQLYPLMQFELTYELLRDDLTTSDLKSLVGLFNALQGRFDNFLFTDPDFNSVTAAQFGTSNGTLTTYQLIAYYQNTGGPGYAELIQNLNGTPTLYDNGSAISGSNYSISSTGVVTFSVVPATGHVLTWSGSFYYRCRFDEDTLDLEKFLSQWWKAKSVKFTSVKL